MIEREYYELLEEITNGGNCEKCSYGFEGNCHLQCNMSYEDYQRDIAKIIGF